MPGDHGHSATSILTGVIIAIYAAALFVGGIAPAQGMMDFLSPGSDFLMSIGLMFNPEVERGEVWRLVTAVFLHLSLIHVLFNASALWSIGRPFEHEIGPAALWTIFFLSGVAGFAVGLVIEPSSGQPIRTGGASGAISGLIGAIIAWRRVVDGHFRHPLTAASIRFAVFTAAFGLVVPGINNLAHGGGFVAGAGLGVLHATTAARGRGMRVWQASAIVGIGLSALSLVGLATAGPRVNSDDVLRMDHCFRTVLQDFERLAASSAAAATTPLDPCLERTEAFDAEPEAAVLVANFRKAARELQDAIAGGMMRELDLSANRMQQAHTAWRAWVMSNLGRFGLEIRSN
jgi:membrane associated rhomboid family serine protease